MSGSSARLLQAAECGGSGTGGAPGEDHWVFGYGSLIWNPGFPFQTAEPALLHGYHRRFCLYSIRYRGTASYPGLVLGLDRGGSCWGRAFRVCPGDWPAVLAYLEEREMGPRDSTWDSYQPRWLSLRLRDSGQRVRALSFVINPDNPRYCRDLTLADMAVRIARAVGPNGSNLAYLEGTLGGLHRLGLRDPSLERLLREVRSHAPAQNQLDHR